MIKKLLLFSAFIYSASVVAQTYTMSFTSLSTCSGTHMDPGGAANYADNSNFTQTICSNSGNCVSMTFTSFALEPSFDFLTIYDGPTASGTQVPGSPFTGIVSPGTVTSSTGCLTLVFTSDVTVNDIGWTATITCGTCPPPPPPPDHTYAWTQMASNPGPGRHRATSIDIGSRGYAGLGHITSSPEIVYQDWWEYDPGTDTWTQKANFGGGMRLHAVAFSIGNFAYVGTGRDEFGAERNDFWKYSPATNTWTPIASIPDAGLRGSVAFAISGKGYVASGSFTNEFWEYTPATNTWAAKAAFPGPGRESGAGFALNGKGYMGTGDGGSIFGDFWQYDPVTDVWTPKATFGGPPRTEGVGFALNGKGYMGMGDDFSVTGNMSDFWRYDDVTDSWLQVADFSGAARRYLTCFVIGTRAYGCFGTNGTNFNDLWEYGNYSGVNSTEVKNIAVKTFPNPFNDVITFSIPRNVVLDKNPTLIIYNSAGELIKKITTASEYEFTLNRGAMSQGMYFYELILNNSTKATGKFIAQ